MNENYNPVERRSKGRKERNLKRVQKSSKSLKTNNSFNSVTVDGDGGIGKTFGPTNEAKTGSVLNRDNSSVEIQKLTKELTDMKLFVDNLEKERDFYFEKLRDIEILCQTSTSEDLPMAVAIKKILYAVDEKESALHEAEVYVDLESEFQEDL